MAKIMELKFELLQHSPYSPDLASGDFFFYFQTWKNGSADNGLRLTGRSSPKKVVYFKDLPKSYFLDGLKKLEKRLEKCIELKGDYVEKKIYTK